MFIFTQLFEKVYDKLVDERKLSKKDFEELERALLENPKLGDVIPGMEGLRKLRLKSIGKGKSGGVRIDYLDIPDLGIIYFVVLYPKNVQEDLNAEEKKIIVRMIKTIKKGS